MVEITDSEFEKLIDAAMDELPEEYIKGLQNVAIVYEDEPTEAQREKLKLRCNQSLYGLYEGVPRTLRGGQTNIFMPDKITIFKNPMINSSSDIPGLKAQVKHTLWHEIAHHYGLDHDRLHKLENKRK